MTTETGVATEVPFSAEVDRLAMKYPYDVNRSAAIFEEAGWRRGADGLLANSAGQHLRLETRNTAGMDQRSAVIADIGIRV